MTRSVNIQPMRRGWSVDVGCWIGFLKVTQCAKSIVGLPDLRVGLLGRAVGPDHDVGAANLFVDRHLRRKALACFGLGESVACHDPLHLRFWIAGNHDPDPVSAIGGNFVAALAIGALAFRHEPSGEAGEIAGHLHPMARVSGRGRCITRRCFASDGARLVMPAFGAFAGGLNVRERAFADVFGTLGFVAYMLGEGRIYALAAGRCLAD